MHTTYFNKAITNQHEVWAMAKEIPADVTHIVGTGLSGTIGATLMSASTGKQLVIVRKPDDRSNHSGATIQTTGKPVEKWVFVDDFICSGNTMRRVYSEIKDAFPDSELIGRICYEHAEVGRAFEPVDDFKHRFEDFRG